MIDIVYGDLSVTIYIDCSVARCLINVVYLTACAFIRSLRRAALLIDAANDADSTKTQSLRHIVSLKSESIWQADK